MSYSNFANITAFVLTLVLGWILCPTSSAQIFIDNASFEDTPADATMPSGWWYTQDGTTPDILPGFWGVYLDPSDGDTYAGLITRENGTYEGIGQRLSQKLKANSCYYFNFDLAYSASYVGYNTPIKLRIYIGSKRKSKDQLIYESAPVDNLEWEVNEVEFTPDKDYQYLILEVHSHSGSDLGGNVLIDNISMIINCNKA